MLQHRLNLLLGRLLGHSRACKNAEAVKFMVSEAEQVISQTSLLLCDPGADEYL